MSNVFLVSETWAFVTRLQRTQLIAAHGEDYEALLFDSYLLNHTCLEDGRVRVPYKVINLCRGVHESEGGTEEWLAAFCARVGATYTDAVFCSSTPSKSRERTVSVDHLAALGLDVDIGARFLQAATEDRVHVVSGAPLGNPERRRGLHYVDDQRKVADYFNNPYVPMSRYTCTQERALYAAPLATALPASQQESVVRTITGSLRVPPMYATAENRTTARLFDRRGHWSVMRSDIRRALFPEWVEVDLQSAYLAIFLKVVKDNRVKTPTSLLEAVVGNDGTGTWERALPAFQTPAEVSKDQIKSFAYALVFGSGKRTAVDTLMSGGLSVADAERVYASPLAKELRAASKATCAYVAKYGYLRDAYGDRTKLIPGISATQVLHFVCSTWELRLVAVAYDCVPANHRGAYIALHQHDGVALGHDDIDALPGLVADVQEAIDAECRALGVRSRAVVKAGPAPAREAPAIARVVAFAE